MQERIILPHPAHRITSSLIGLYSFMFLQIIVYTNSRKLNNRVRHPHERCAMLINFASFAGMAFPRQLSTLSASTTVFFTLTTKLERGREKAQLFKFSKHYSGITFGAKVNRFRLLSLHQFVSYY